MLIQSNTGASADTLTLAADCPTPLQTHRLSTEHEQQQKSHHNTNTVHALIHVHACIHVSLFVIEEDIINVHVHVYTCIYNYIHEEFIIREIEGEIYTCFNER